MPTTNGCRGWLSLCLSRFAPFRLVMKAGKRVFMRPRFACTWSRWSRLTSETPLWDGRTLDDLDHISRSYFQPCLPCNQGKARDILSIFLCFLPSKFPRVATKESEWLVLRIRSSPQSCILRISVSIISPQSRSRGKKGGGELSQSHHATFFFSSGETPPPAGCWSNV